MKKLTRIIKAIAGLYLLIMAIVIPHELAHFYFLRVYSVPVKELSLGFGPRLLGAEASGVDLSFRVIPLGGYVMSKDKINLPFSQYIITLVSGGLVNVFLGVLLWKRWRREARFMVANGILNLLPTFLISDGGKILSLILKNIGVDRAISSFIITISGMVIIFLYFWFF